jgi:hypothetical protein
MEKSLLSKILIIIGSMVLVGAVVLFVVNEQGNETKIITDNTHSELKDNSNDYSMDVKTLRNEKNNSEIYGVLRVDNVEFYSIITKSTDNKYYLDHSISGKKNNSGNPFMDYRNDSLNNKEVIIYGKSNNKEFNKLSNLFNRDTFNKETKLELYTEKETATYILKFVKMSGKVLTDLDLIKEEEKDVKVYNDTTDRLENLEVIEEKKEEETNNEKVEEKEVNIFESLYKDSKYCKDDCMLNNDDNVLVIEIVNEESVSSNMIIVGVKSSK